MGGPKRSVTQVRQVRLSQNALRNIDEVTGYIAFINLEPLNALKVGDHIFNTIDRIAKHPFAFRECEWLPTRSKMYRRAICLTWQIIYRITEAEIIILGVVHASRKPGSIRILRSIK